MAAPSVVDPDVFGDDGSLEGGDVFDGTLADDEGGTPIGLEALDDEIDLERKSTLPVPEGRQLLVVSEIVSAKFGPSGYPNVRFRATCIQGPGKDTSLFENVSLSPNARWRLDLFLDAIHAPRSGRIRPREFVGRQFWADVAHEEYDGRTQARVAAYIDGPTPDQPEVQDTPAAAAPSVNGAAPAEAPPAVQLPARPQGPPATPKQVETIKRLAAAAGEVIGTDNLSRSQASATISRLIERMNEDDDQSAPEPVAPAAPARPSRGGRQRRTPEFS